MSNFYIEMIQRFHYIV